MVGFFTGLLLVGFSSIIISIVLVMYDRKRDVEEKEELISLKKELRGLLEDSNDMVDELNKFSDYIVTTVDEKCTEFKNVMKDAPVIKTLVQEAEVSNKVLKDVSVVDNNNDVAIDIENNLIVQEDNLFSEDIEPISSSNEAKSNGANPKHAEVMRLFESGMNDIEIARTLNMGKGEVQLIVGLNLHKIKL